MISCNAVFDVRTIGAFDASSLLKYGHCPSTIEEMQIQATKRASVAHFVNPDISVLSLQVPLGKRQDLCLLDISERRVD